MSESSWIETSTILAARPQISGHIVLWHCDYYDGYLSGMLEHNNKRYWFYCVDDILLPHPLDKDNEGEYINDRLFFVYQLTDEQYDHQMYWYELFKEHVGTHTTYFNRKGKIRKGSIKPHENHSKFYNRAKKDRKDLDLSKNEVVGWFLDSGGR